MDNGKGQISKSEFYEAKVIAQADFNELFTIFKSLRRPEINGISSLVGLHLGDPRNVQDSLVVLCMTKAMQFKHFEEFHLFISYLVADAEEFSKEFLKDSFPDPSNEQVIELATAMVDKFGILRTQLLFASCIDGEAKAGEFAKKLFEVGGMLSLRDRSNETHIPLPKPPSEKATIEAKLKRKFKRKLVRRQREAIKVQHKKDQDNRRILRRAIRKLAVANRLRTESNKAQHVADLQHVVIHEPKRVHPGILRYGIDAINHNDVGKIGYTFIGFTGDQQGEGKVRPALVIAKTRRFYVVRPIYSKPNKPAGGFRAVTIDNWTKAGLEHLSYVGDEQHEIKIKKIKLSGELTLHDWNQVCLGEVNSA